MIDKVVLRNWKRFKSITFDLNSRHVVLVGPNNSGKTSVLQAIASWGFVLQRWRELNPDLNQRNGWKQVPVTLNQFTPVSVRSFDLLWRDRGTRPSVIEVHAGGATVAMEFERDAKSQYQFFARPTGATTRRSIERLNIRTLFVPSMTGLQIEEPVLTTPKIDQMLGRNRPGEVLRNLLYQVSNDPQAWSRLVDTVRDLFGIEMLPPNATGADIVAEYCHVGRETHFDLASAGSGFQQVVMLLAFLERPERSVLLLDEPDAHLHVFLQERIVEVLRKAAARSRSLLVVATHSEVVIDTVEHDEVYVLLDQQPVRLADDAAKESLKDALRVIDHNDLAKAREAPGVLYLEDYTDLAILREWARILGHPAEKLLGPHVFWHKVAIDLGPGRSGIRAQDHFEALRLARPGYPGFQLVDGDSKVQSAKGMLEGTTPPKLRLRRYEIESYLLHPAAIERFVIEKTASAAPEQTRSDVRTKMAELLTREYVEDPSRPNKPAQAVLENTKARTELLPPILSAGGLLGFPYQRFHEIAGVMEAAEIHGDVREVLDAIARTLGSP